MKNGEKSPKAHAFTSTHPPSLNARDRAILETLEAEPEATASRLAKVTRIPVDSVRHRLVTLRKRGAIRDICLVNRAFIGYSVRAMVSIDLGPPELRSKKLGYSDQHGFCEFISKRLNQRAEFRAFTSRVKVESVFIVLGGRCDLVVFVAAPDPPAICDFVTRALRFLPGVQNSNTAMIF